jgi:hypothetical protein
VSAGAWVRSGATALHAEWFGLSAANSGADNVTAFSGLMAVAALGDSAVQIGPGSFSFNAAVAYSTAHKLILTGAGSRVTSFVWTASGSGLQITYTDENLSPHISGISFRNSHLGVGNGLKIIAPIPGLSTLKGCILTDLDFKGVNETAHCWSTALYLYQCWFPVIRDCNIKGQTTASIPMSMAYGLYMDNCMVCKINAVTVYHANVAFGTGGTTNAEGLEIAGGCQIVGCNYGAVINAPAGTASGCNIVGNHFNCYTGCIVIADRHGAYIAGNLCYKTGGTADWVGINFTGGAENIATNNLFFVAAGSTGSNTGIFLVGSASQCIIMGNLFQGFTVAGYGIFLGNTADYNHIVHNRGFTNVTAAYLNVGSGTHNTYVDNAP